MPTSRAVPWNEKTCPAHLINAEGYRQILALGFAIGDKVRVKEDPDFVREITSVTAYEGRVLYALDGGFHPIWEDDELFLVKEVTDANTP
jgi:hypothetical protein